MQSTMQPTSPWPTSFPPPLPSPSSISVRKSRRPSLPHAMSSWLHKNSSSASTSSSSNAPANASRTVSKSPRNSEQKLKPNLISGPTLQDDLSHVAPRKGPLGAGATVVRTPQEALSGTVAPLYNNPPRALEDKGTVPVINKSVASTQEHSHQNRVDPAPRPQNIPSPALPITPMATPPPRPAPKMRAVSSTSPPPSEIYPDIPPVPAFVPSFAAPPPPPPFAPVLLSNLPTNMHSLPPARVLVSLETTTQKHKTTLATLTAYPSHLASYLAGLVAATSTDNDQVVADPDAASVYSQQTDGETPNGETNDSDSVFDTIFNNHLVSTGLVPRTRPKRRADVSAHIDIFLDRPSEPYAHILAYLRTPPSPSTPSSSHPTFPPSSIPGPPLIRTSSSSPAAAAPRIDALLDLRDEALFLGLADLHARCAEDIAKALALRQRQAVAPTTGHMRGQSAESTVSGSANSASGRSVSMHALRECGDDVDTEIYTDDRYARNSDGGDSRSRAKELPAVDGLQLDLQARGRSQSQDRNRNRDADGSARTRPAHGWI